MASIITKQQVRRLWELCFNESESFNNLYFSKRYTPQRNVAIESNGRVVAALQILPYPMTFYGVTLPIGYLSGVCVHPDLRGRGLMKELIAQAFKKMRAQGMPFCALIPANEGLFHAYAKCGFAPIFNRSTEIFRRADASSSTIYSLQIDSPAAWAFLEHQLRQRPCCVQHTQEDLKVVAHALRLEGGHLYAIERNGKIEAAAVSYPYGLEEIVALSPTARTQLLAAICKENNTHTLSIATPGNTSHFGMGCLIDPQALLSIYAAHHPQLTYTFTLTHSPFAECNTSYRIHQGLCNPTAPAHTHLTSTQLTEFLFAHTGAHMSLMLS